MRVCLYTRISTDEENQPTSLHSQRERLEAFVRSQEGWRVVAHEEDRATGTKLDRPGLQAALELARAGEDRSAARLPRRPSRAARCASWRSLLRSSTGSASLLRSATEPFDTGAAAGRMMLQMLAVFAEFEHATIVDRITAGIERRAKEGRWATGRLAFGYRRDDDKLVVPDEREAPVVRRVFRLYTRGPARHDLDRAAAHRRVRAGAGQGLAARRRAVAARERGLPRPRPLARPELPRPARTAHRRAHLPAQRRRCCGSAARTLAAARQPLRLPALRRDPLRPLQARLRRHERQGQRRPLPLLRLLRPAEARPQRLRRRAPQPRQARSRRASTSSPASTATAS